MNPRASEETYYNNYKSIRNVLRKYDPNSVLDAAVKYLYQSIPEKLERLKRRPWVGMLLIKWAFIDEQARFKGRPPIPPREFMRIYQAAIDLGDSTNSPNQYPVLSMFVRAIAYQQFFYQRDSNALGHARQELFFSVPHETLSKRRFLETKGISIPDFLRLSLITAIRVIDERNPMLDFRSFGFLEPEYKPQQIRAFLDALSVPLKDLSKTLQDSDSIGRSIREYHAPTAFLAYPLIRIGADYLCVYPEVLQRASEHFVYDALKRLGDANVDRAFGTTFEHYVGERLRETKLPLTTESDLKAFLPGDGKLIDFLVSDAEANVFIEAKGVEMSITGMITTRRGDIRNALENSLCKAVRQAYEVNARLAAVGDTHPLMRYQSSSYLLAITYKELYIQNGITLREVIGDEKFDALGKGIAPQHLIPPENMYFLTIEELEHFVEFVKVGKPRLVEGIELAKASDAHPQTHKFAFHMHFHDWDRPIDTIPTSLLEAQNRLFVEVQRAVDLIRPPNL